jgi:hypothetical protein
LSFGFWRTAKAPDCIEAPLGRKFLYIAPLVVSVAQVIFLTLLERMLEAVCPIAEGLDPVPEAKAGYLTITMAFCEKNHYRKFKNSCLETFS